MFQEVSHALAYPQMRFAQFVGDSGLLPARCTYSVLRQRGWVAVTRRYCIKTAKPILKLFRQSGSPISL